MIVKCFIKYGITKCQKFLLSNSQFTVLLVSCNVLAMFYVWENVPIPIVDTVFEFARKHTLCGCILAPQDGLRAQKLFKF